MTRLLSVLTLLVGLSALAQDDDMTVRRIAMKTVADLTDEAMHGRGYVNNGDALAAEYIVQKFKDLGLSCFKEGMEQEFHFPVNTFPGEMSVIVDGQPLKPGEDFIVHPASGGVKGNFELVDFNMRRFLDGSLDLTQMKGKALVCTIPSTQDRDSLGLFHALTELLMDGNPVVIKDKGKLIWSVARESHAFPLIEVKSGSWPDSASYVDLDIEQSLEPSHSARNVVAYVKGRKKKKEYVVITAHYDHLGRMGNDTYFPGANDNASGVAMLLSLADHFARHQPERSIVFMAFAGEEAGLIGSHHYIEDPMFELSKIRFLVNLDILGTGDDGIMVVNATKEQEEFDQLVAINGRTDRLPAVKKRGPSCNSDHCAFVEHGVPAFFIYTLGGVAFYHDVYDKGETLPLTAFPQIRSSIVDFISELE